LLVLIAVLCVISNTEALDQWKQISEFHHTFLTGVSFTTDTTGWISGFGGFHNGPIVYNTSSSGTTWSNQTFTRRESLSFTCVAMDPSGVGFIAGNGALIVPGVLYTTDFGNKWEDSDVLHLETRFRDCGQVAGTNGSFSWAVGQWFKVENLKGEGLVLSEDGGKRFLYFDWGVGLPARFGSFLSKNYGFIAGGRYPQILFTDVEGTIKISSEDPKIERLSALFAIYNGKLLHAAEHSLKEDHTYLGAIARTDNRGRRFNLMYNTTLNDLNVCFNGISFVDSYNGWVVAEGYNTTTGKHGGWIFNTVNAGMTWRQQLFVEHTSFLRIKMLNANEGWAIGGKIPSPFLVSGMFYHTTNGGSTWSNESHRDIFPLNIDFIDSNHGYATVLTLEGNTQVFQYKQGH